MDRFTNIPARYVAAIVAAIAAAHRRQVELADVGPTYAEATVDGVRAWADVNACETEVGIKIASRPSWIAVGFGGVFEADPLDEPAERPRRDSVARFRVLGTTEDVETCDCCGRTGLKKTVILGELDCDGNVSDECYFGVVCASKATGYRRRYIDDRAAAADIRHNSYTGRHR